jgi:hypothetical protein
MTATVGATRAWVSDVVRSGLWSDDRVRDEVITAIEADHPDLPPGETADAWIAEARVAWAADAAAWPDVTDHDRLLDAFARLERRDVLVLQGVSDHWVARDELQHRTPTPSGVAWFTATDVRHAIDAGMLEVNLWHGDTANAAPGDALLDDAIEAFAASGLTARFDEGRIEVAARWQRRPAN